MRIPGWRPICIGSSYYFRSSVINFQRAYWYVVVWFRSLPSWTVPAATGLTAIVLLLLLVLYGTPETEFDHFELVTKEAEQPTAEIKAAETETESVLRPALVFEDVVPEVTSRDEVAEEPTFEMVLDSKDPFQEEPVEEKQSPPAAEFVERETPDPNPWAERETEAPMVESALAPEVDFDALTFRMDLSAFSDEARILEESFVVNSTQSSAFEFTTAFENSEVDASESGWNGFRAVHHDEVVIPASYENRPDANEDLATTGEWSAAQGTSESKQVDVSVTRDATDAFVLNQPSSYSLVVQNNTDSIVDAISIQEQVPSNCRVIEVAPAADFSSGSLTWNLQNLRPNERRKLSVQIFPLAEGDTSASSTIRTTAAVNRPTSVTEPSTQLSIHGSSSGEIARWITFRFQIKNNGPIDISAAALHVTLSQNLVRRGHRKLVYPIRSLAVGETATAFLSVHGTSAGRGTADARIVIGEFETSHASSQVTIRASDVVTRSNPPTKTQNRCGITWTPARSSD